MAITFVGGPVSDQIIDLMHKGDDRCPIKIGNRVEKCLLDEGDFLPIGSKGICTGSYFMQQLGNVYLVLFDGQSTEAFLREARIKKTEP